MTTSSSAHERTTAAASTATDEGRHVAGVAKDEAHHVASEAATQARHVAQEVLRDVSGQMSEQSRTQQDRLSTTLRSLGDDLEKMAAQADTGLAGDLAREVADRARSASQHLEGREPAELLDDVRRFARQRPGTFLIGALGAGVVAGRLLRGTKDGAQAAAAQPAQPPVQPAQLAQPTPQPSPSLGAPDATATLPRTPTTQAGISGTVDPSLPTETGTPLGGGRP